MRRDTQDEAWESIQEDIPRLERRVLSTIAKVQDGMTCDEVEVITTMTHQTTSATINSLCKKGMLKDSGKRRPTRRGRAAIVWTLGDGKPVQKAPTAKSLLRRCAALLRNAEPYWALAHEGEEKAWQEEREAVLKAIEGKGAKKGHGLPREPEWPSVELALYGCVWGDGEYGVAGYAGRGYGHSWAYGYGSSLGGGKGEEDRIAPVEATMVGHGLGYGFGHSLALGHGYEPCYGYGLCYGYGDGHGYGDEDDYVYGYSDGSGDNDGEA